MSCLPEVGRTLGSYNSETKLAKLGLKRHVLVQLWRALGSHRALVKTDRFSCQLVLLVALAALVLQESIAVVGKRDFPERLVQAVLILHGCCSLCGLAVVTTAANAHKAGRLHRQALLRDLYPFSPLRRSLRC